MFLRPISLASVFVLTLPGLATAQSFFDPFSPFATSAPATIESVDETKFKEADKAYQSGNYSRVQQLANELLVTNPDSFLALHLRASARVEMGRKARSTQQLRSGIEDARRALSLQGDKYPWLYIPYMFGMTSLSEIENRPVHAQLALGAVRPVFSRSELKSEEKCQLHFQSGLANLAIANPKVAIRDFEQALAIDPRHVAANIKLAQTHAAGGDLKSALTSMDKAVEMLPNTALVFNERGMLRRQTGELESAVEDFSSAIRIDPKFAVAMINRGVTLMDQNQAAAAEVDFDSALRLQPQNHGVRQLRGAARTVLGNFDEAIADYTAVSRANQTDPLPVQERGFAKFFKGDYANAIRDFEWSYGRQPGSMFLALWQALSLLRSGQNEAGMAVLEKLLERPSTETGWVGTVASYLTGRIDEGALLKAAVDPQGNPVPAMECEAHFFIAQKKLLADDAAGARESLEKAVALNLPNMAAHRAARFEAARQ